MTEARHSALLTQGYVPYYQHTGNDLDDKHTDNDLDDKHTENDLDDKHTDNDIRAGRAGLCVGSKPRRPARAGVALVDVRGTDGFATASRLE